MAAAVKNTEGVAKRHHAYYVYVFHRPESYIYVYSDYIYRPGLLFIQAFSPFFALSSRLRVPPAPRASLKDPELEPAYTIYDNKSHFIFV